MTESYYSQPKSLMRPRRLHFNENLVLNAKESIQKYSSRSLTSVNPNNYRTGEASDRLSEALPQNEIPIPVNPKSKKYMSSGQYERIEG